MDLASIKSSKTLQKILPFLALLFLGVAWGGLINAMKAISQTGFPKFNYAFWVLAISTIIVICINLARGKKIPPLHLKFYFICGLTSFALPQTLMYLVLETIPAGLMALLIATTPIVTYVISLAMRVENLHNLKIVGVVLGFFGTMLIVLSSNSGAVTAPLELILVAIIPIVCYAFYTSYVARYVPARLGALDMSIGMLVMSTAILFCVLLIAESFVPIWEGSPFQIAVIIYHGVVTALAIVVFNALIKHSGALFASTATYFITVFGIFFGAILHDEVLPITVWVAAVLIFGGLGFIQRGKYLSKVYG